ncbi:MAG: hypothetical protein IJ662_13460 [Clostridia bacterium]|nr:hypothetical protein [Clostridia bacterium]
MKRWLWLLPFLLLALPACAQEYAGYTLPADRDPYSFLALNRRDTIVRSWVENDLNMTLPNHITWYRDGQVLRDLPYYPRGVTASLESACFVATREDAFKTLVLHQTGAVTAPTGTETAREIPVYRCSLYDWTEKGLEHPVDIPLGTATLCIAGPYILTVDNGPGGSGAVRVYDAEGKLQQTIDLPGAANLVLVNAKYLGQDTFLISGHDGDYGAYARMALRDGKLLWRIHTPQYYDVHGDGRGGFFAVEDQNCGDYSSVTLAHYDENGQVDRRRTLINNTLVKHIMRIYPHPDGSGWTAYGMAVANSRRVYTVFALTLDEEMNAVAWDIRGLSKQYRDYSPGISLAADGTVQVLTSSIGNLENKAPAAVIPFDALPAQTDGISFRWE